MSEHDLETLITLHAECLEAEHLASSHQTTSDRNKADNARGEFEDWHERCLRKLGL